MYGIQYNHADNCIKKYGENYYIQCYMTPYLQIHLLAAAQCYAQSAVHVVGVHSRGGEPDLRAHHIRHRVLSLRVLLGSTGRGYLQ